MIGTLARFTDEELAEIKWEKTADGGACPFVWVDAEIVEGLVKWVDWQTVDGIMHYQISEGDVAKDIQAYIDEINHYRY
jgi:hypothetical protein